MRLQTASIANFRSCRNTAIEFSGHVTLQIALSGGPNAVVSGLFFDPPGVNVSPTNISVAPNQTQQFNAVLTSSTNQAVTWSVNPSLGLGTISSSGLYTAPASLPTEQPVIVTATSVADPTL